MSLSVHQDIKFSVVPEKKLCEIKSWFQEHFETSARIDYLKRSPFVVIQGPTGCGKTTTLERIADELQLSIKEYSETTDTSHIQSELQGAPLERDGSISTTLQIDRRRSHIFESFVINNVRYETLYADQPRDEDDAAAEFDDDDDFIAPIFSRTQPKPPPKGVIILIESPLAFGRSTPVLIQCLRKLKKVIKEISCQTPRRVAIVFEAVDDNDHVMSLPSVVKQTLGIHLFKLNPVTRANMKKFIESELKQYNYVYPNKETLEQLIDDCDGDVSACKNTLHFLCRPRSRRIITAGIHKFSSTPVKPSKKQKLEHDRVGRLSLHPNLLRDISRGSGFFHILGKIFYQKRFYPDLNYSRETNGTKQLRCIDRPYRTENTTENLVNQVGCEAKKLNSWLHQNYTRYCAPSDIEKAALFMENLSIADTMSLDSTQSTQYYENFKFIDLMQKHLAIESTVFSLYKDESMSKKTSDKKVVTGNRRAMILRSSVDTSSTVRMDSYQGFAKPTSLIISKISEDHQALLDKLSSKMTRVYGRPYERNDLLLDYAPYMKILSDRSASHQAVRYTLGPPLSESQTSTRAGPHDDLSFSGQEHMRNMIEEIQRIDDSSEVDYERRHEKLVELIDECDSQKVEKESGDITMSKDSGLDEVPMFD